MLSASSYVRDEPVYIMGLDAAIMSNRKPYQHQVKHLQQYHSPTLLSNNLTLNQQPVDPLNPPNSKCFYQLHSSPSRAFCIRLGRYPIRRRSWIEVCDFGSPSLYMKWRLRGTQLYRSPAIVTICYAPSSIQDTALQQVRTAAAIFALRLNPPPQSRKLLLDALLLLLGLISSQYHCYPSGQCKAQRSHDNVPSVKAQQRLLLYSHRDSYCYHSRHHRHFYRDCDIQELPGRCHANCKKWRFRDRGSRTLDAPTDLP